jgi:hypothetical protein
MTNLIEIFQFLNDYDEDSRSNLFKRSVDMFGPTGHSRSSFIDQIKAVERIESWFTSLVSDSLYTLSDGDYSIDFVFLCESLQAGRIRDMYINIKAIRAEMLAIATPDTFEEFKKLNEFWQSMELSLRVVVRSAPPF